MFINEVSKLTKLTKKAIEYYTSQGLLSPSVAENGYRAYSGQDITRLEKIRVLRKLDIPTEEIKQILDDKTNAALRTVAVKKELELQQDRKKQAILQKLCEGSAYEGVSAELQAVEQGKTILDRLLSAFPGYYGRFVCMHFARFLNEPIQSPAQQAAYETVLSFLDAVPALDIPKELEDYMTAYTSGIGTDQISDMLDAVKKSYENPDAFLQNNAEMLESYLQFKKSAAYKNSSACKLMELLRTFNRTSGYNDVFIPAMKQLSASYAAYYRRMETANEKLLAQYPEIQKLYDAENGDLT